MRSKEHAHDYRYFPDPDLLPLVLDANWVNEIKATLPELPDEKRGRFVKDFGLSDYDAGVLVGEKENLPDLLSKPNSSELTQFEASLASRPLATAS